MERNTIEGALQEYFAIEELVCPHTFKKFGATSWKFLDTSILEVLFALRTQILKVPLVCNTYKKNPAAKGVFSQRGLRCNCCELVKNKKDVYLSAHVLGKGLDLQSPKMDAETMRKKIEELQHLLPHGVRIERDVRWLHIDTLNKNKGIVYFNG